VLSLLRRVARELEAAGEVGWLGGWGICLPHRESHCLSLSARDSRVGFWAQTTRAAYDKYKLNYSSDAHILDISWEWHARAFMSGSKTFDEDFFVTLARLDQERKERQNVIPSRFGIMGDLMDRGLDFTKAGMEAGMDLTIGSLAVGVAATKLTTQLTMDTTNIIGDVTTGGYWSKVCVPNQPCPRPADTSRSNLAATLGSFVPTSSTRALEPLVCLLVAIEPLTLTRAPSARSSSIGFSIPGRLPRNLWSVRRSSSSSSSSWSSWRKRRGRRRRRRLTVWYTLTRSSTSRRPHRLQV
jgi:hypothetical protein